MKILIVEYGVIMIACLIERKWVMATYWLGACILTLAVVLLNNK